MVCIDGWIECHPGTASWVQAVASVVAIVWAGYSARRLQVASERRRRKEVASILREIAESVTSVTSYVQRELPDRAALHRVASGMARFEMDEVRGMERVLNEIPLHDLPSPDFVRPTLMLRSAIRQLRNDLEEAIARHRKMDAADFDGLFRTIREANKLCFDLANKITSTAVSI
ncbi:TPA: hypothetical protein QDB48_000611 [Burkholderia vietnamiensis]|uniref:hypothetical protein n=1 Tax=Burkholderia sp. 572 TaxID=3156414 RepID=UPI0032F39E4A|nr:hypothetical protein [Burkholderia vietnamiensis]